MIHQRLSGSTGPPASRRPGAAAAAAASDGRLGDRGDLAGDSSRTSRTNSKFPEQLPLKHLVRCMFPEDTRAPVSRSDLKLVLYR